MFRRTPQVPAIGFLALLALAIPASAVAQEGIRARGMLGAAHALGEPQKSEFGWGALASAGAELPIRPELFAAFSLEGMALAEGAAPPARFAPQGTGKAAFFLFGLRAYPIPGGDKQLRAWLSAQTGYARTGSFNRVGLAADLGVDFPVGDVDAGPFLGYRHILQPDSELRPDDANIGLVGVQVSLSQRKRLVAAPEDPDIDRDGIPNQVDACPNDPEDFDGYQDDDGCPDLDNDKDRIPDAADKCPNDPEDYDGFEDQDGCPDPDNDKDGIPDSSDKCPNAPEDKDGFEDQDGCPDPDNDKDGIPDAHDQCPDEPETKNGYADEDGCPDEQSVRVVGARILLDDTIYFDWNLATIRARSMPLVEHIATLLKSHPEYLQISIEGHTDEMGSASYNQKLSEDRASAVRDVLIKDGVEPYRIVWVGYGEARPLVKGAHSAEEQSRNRRVEFYITRRATRTGETLPAPTPDTPKPAPQEAP
jgi:outer membrane protein OmpA-like peptidoglycan-associated protein